MEMTAYIVLGLGIVFFVLFFKKYFTSLIEGSFEVEAQAVVKFVLFRSFNWFRFSFPGFLILINIYIIYEILNISNDAYSRIFSAVLLCITCAFSYKFFQVLSSNQNFFEFVKYSSSVKFYRELAEIERRQIHSVFMKRLGLLPFNSLGSGELADFFNNEYFPKISSMLSFERFDHWLENSDSRSYTGSLFCTKFKKSVDAELADIKRLYDLGRLSIHNLPAVVSVMLSPGMLYFDDKNGLHYGREEVSRILENICEQIEVTGNGMKSSGFLSDVDTEENMQKNVVGRTDSSTHSNRQPTEVTDPLFAIRQDERLDSAQTKIMLPEGRVVTELRDSIINDLIRMKVKMSDYNKEDIRFFVGNRFKNSSNRQFSNLGEDYLDRRFFTSNAVAVVKCIRNVGRKFGIRENVMNKILAEEFPGIFSYQEI